jgi:hypothetical protein
LDWSTIDAGGGTSSAEGYTLSGTIGRSDAGTLTDSGCTLVGGFWTARQIAHEIYLPSAMRQHG